MAAGLLAGKALRQRLGADLHRGERLAALAEGLRAAPPVPDADQPLHVFGLSQLAPAELAVLQALAVRRPVVLYVPDPCREFWAGLRTDAARLRDLAKAPYSEENEAFFLDQGHPLLAAWGRLGQHFMLQLQDLEARLDVRHFRDEAGADVEPASRLARVQSVFGTDTRYARDWNESAPTILRSRGKRGSPFARTSFLIAIIASADDSGRRSRSVWP